MSNRGRHKKEKYIAKLVIAYKLLNYKFTQEGLKSLHKLIIDPYSLCTIYLNKYNEICQIEVGTEILKNI